MWKWITCYLSGNHEFGVACEPGAIFLRCAHCGKRSHGWALSGTPDLRPAAVKMSAAADPARRAPAREAARAA